MVFDNLFYEKKFEIPYYTRKKLGEYICKQRENKNLKLSELSKMTGISLNDLHRFEYGTFTEFNIFKLKEVCNSLDIQMTFILKMIGIL